jgi:hypothetical protein
MTEPIVFVSRNRIVEGRRAEWAAAYANAVDLIRSTKPRTALFAAYLDSTGSSVSVVHAFPDAAALARHFEGSDERSRSVSELIEPIDFEVYGPAPREAVDQLRREAGGKGVRLDIHMECLGGFLRAPV